MSRTKRGRRYWQDSTEIPALPPVVRQRLQGSKDEERYDFLFELNTSNVSPLVLYEFVDFLELVFDATVDQRSYAGGRTCFTIEGTKLHTDTGVRVGVRFYRLPRPKKIEKYYR